MAEKYVNKFHNFKFETNAKEDLEINAPKLSRSLSNENIGDDCSNEVLLQNKYSAEEVEKISDKI